jgi:SOS-response transcriptional repressor LexA
MTPMQSRVLAAIRRLTVDDVSPSYSEIAFAVGLASRGRVHAIIHGLHRDGYIDFSAHGSRNIRILTDRQAYTDTELAKLDVTSLETLLSTVEAVLAAKRGRAA